MPKEILKIDRCKVKCICSTPNMNLMLQQNLSLVLRLVLVGVVGSSLICEFGIILFKFLPVTVHSEQFMPWQ